MDSIVGGVSNVMVSLTFTTRSNSWAVPLLIDVTRSAVAPLFIKLAPIPAVVISVHCSSIVVARNICVYDLSSFSLHRMHAQCVPFTLLSIISHLYTHEPSIDTSYLLTTCLE